MAIKSPHKLSLTLIYAETFGMLKKNPVIFLPFAVMAFLEFVVLTVWYLAPRMPLKALLGPPIRTFFGERFLHFPFNFLLLPKLVSNSKILLAVALGSLVSCVALVMIFDIFRKKNIKLGQAVKSGAGKYLSAFCVVVLMYGAYFLMLKLFSMGLVKYFSGHRTLLSLRAAVWFGPISALVNLLAGLVSQALFLYALPLLVIEQKKLLAALGGSILLLKKLFWRTAALVILPLMAYSPVLVLNYKMVFLMDNSFPEIVLVLLAGSILVSTMVLDPVITCSTALLYLKHTRKQE